MFKSLNAGMLNLKLELPALLRLAQSHGFGGIDATVDLLRQQPLPVLADAFATTGSQRGVCFGLLPVRLTGDDWDAAMATLPANAALAQAAGFTRTTVVMLPFDDAMPFATCFTHCVGRLRQAATILADHGIALGVEYVSQLTRRAGHPFPFIATLDGTLALLAAADRPNLGLLLDSFHWHCAGETAADISSLSGDLIVSVHLADAPAKPLPEQLATVRELPGSGCADLRAFCAAVTTTGYSGPAACEPFCQAFASMPADTVAAQVSAALDTVLA